MPGEPAAFVIVGMMALFGGIAHAPLAVMLMVAEMTGNLSLLAPAMIAVAVSTALAGDETIYRSQLRDRASSPFHRLRLSFPMLSALLVRDAMVPWRPTPGDEATTARELVLDASEPLDVALARLADAGASWAPVRRDGELVGRITVRDMVAAYRTALQRSVRRAAALPASASLFEARLAAASPLAGRTLSEAKLPRDTLVVAVTRAGTPIFPHASTRLEADDLLTIITSPATEHGLQELLGEAPAGRTGAPG
jgi:CIC family chloride channel protein